MSGRRFVIAFLGFVAVFAAALVWFQYFAFYERADGVGALQIGGATVPVSDYRGIDATSSPLKLRGCFRIDPKVVAGLEPDPGATPLTPPPWFRCFDARQLSADLAQGSAEAFRIARDAPEGFDTLIAVYPDGRGYVWRQLSPRYEG